MFNEVRKNGLYNHLDASVLKAFQREGYDLYKPGFATLLGLKSADPKPTDPKPTKRIGEQAEDLPVPKQTRKGGKQSRSSGAADRTAARQALLDQIKQATKGTTPEAAAATAMGTGDDDDDMEDSCSDI